MEQVWSSAQFFFHFSKSSCATAQMQFNAFKAHMSNWLMFMVVNLKPRISRNKVKSFGLISHEDSARFVWWSSMNYPELRSPISNVIERPSFFVLLGLSERTETAFKLIGCLREFNWTLAKSINLISSTSHRAIMTNLFNISFSHASPFFRRNKKASRETRAVH